MAIARQGASAGPPDGPTSPPSTSARLPESPIPIFLKAPADRDEIWKWLARPDFVVLDGELYRQLRRDAEAARKPPPRPVVQSVAIGGEVDGDLARLSIEFRIALDDEVPTWVPIHLDGLSPAEVREGDRDLPARPNEDRSWSVELSGRREHVVRVSVLVPVRSTPEGRRLELAIPPAASTRLGLDSLQPVIAASAGPDEPVGVGPADGKPGIYRMAARLGPRSRLDLAWREPPAAGLKMAPLLTCLGEIAADVEPGSIRIRSSWLVGAIRGSASRLTLRLDPAEEVVEVLVGDRPVPFESRRESGRLVIPLPEPVVGTQSASLVITSRRTFATPGPARVLLQGYAFDDAKSQSGTLAITRVGPLFLNPTPGRALRRIDPRIDLPEALRARQDIALAFEFNDQPFELQLGIDPAPPRIQVEARTNLTIASRSAKVETLLDCRVAQGRPYEVRVLVPEGLIFEEAGPPDLISPAQFLSPEAEPGRPRVLVLTLNRQAREAGSFVLKLRGRVSIEASKVVAVPFFRVPPEASNGGRIEVFGDRDVSVELDEPRGEASPFRSDLITGPVRTLAALARPAVPEALLSLRYDSDPGVVPLRVAILPRTIRHESTLTATIDRKGAEVSEDVTLEVAHGTISSLDLFIPPEVPADWEVEGIGRASRELLGQEPDGSRRYRIGIARGDAGTFRLRFRYRAPIVEGAAPGSPSRLRLDCIRVVEGVSASCVARIVADAGFDPKAEGPGWTAVDPAPAIESGPSIRIALSRSVIGAGPIEVEIRPRESVVLPSLIASRLWLRTAQRSDGELATSANYWLESRERSITVALPPGSRWIRARIGGVDLGPADFGRIGPDEYRIDVPAVIAPGPVLLGLEYLATATTAVGGWPAPELRGGIVQQTLWEFHTIGTRAGVGVPRDWTDENEWFWDGLLWRRKPSRSPAEISRWLSGGTPPDRLAEPLESDQSEERHSYLFSRPGQPSRLDFPVYSRLSLFLFCSGPVLLAGLLILARRPRPRLSAAVGLVVAFAVGVASDLNAAILIAQSSALGFLLLLAAVGMNFFLDRKAAGRPAVASGHPEPDRMTISATVRGEIVGSDDSTAIRPRPAPPAASTADHILLRHPAGGEPLTTDLNTR